MPASQQQTDLKPVAGGTAGGRGRPQDRTRPRWEQIDRLPGADPSPRCRRCRRPRTLTAPLRLAGAGSNPGAHTGKHPSHRGGPVNAPNRARLPGAGHDPGPGRRYPGAVQRPPTSRGGTRFPKRGGEAATKARGSATANVAGWGGDARAGAHALRDTASGAERGRAGPSGAERGLARPCQAGPRGGGAGPPAAQDGPAGLPTPMPTPRQPTGSRPTIPSNTGPGPGRTPHSQVLRWTPHNPLTPVTAPGHTTSARHDSSPDRRDGAPSPHTEVPTPPTLCPITTPTPQSLQTKLNPHASAQGQDGLGLGHHGDSRQMGISRSVRAHSLVSSA
ncbi:synapsin-1-like [Camelus ferus]|uniref:Synapsin-1-like n=1 Tax=Camelus ferus TaxID=419612 RepID=A0A8B8SAA4_CAMFR|nr:synapsin-1-like [Camelus ferus]